MKTSQVKETKKIVVTNEGNREEVEVAINFQLKELETVEDLRELLDELTTEAGIRLLSGVNSIIKGAATYKVAKYNHVVESGDESPEEIPDVVDVVWALSPVQGGRFSYRKAAEQARMQAMELPALLAKGGIDQAAFLAQFAELTAKAQEMDQKADEQAAQRKPRKSKGNGQKKN